MLERKSSSLRIVPRRYPPILKGSYALLVGGFFAFFLLFKTVLFPSLPSEETPIFIYGNQNGDDLKRIFQRAIQRANSSLFLQVYGLTEEDLIQEIRNASSRGVQTTVFYDPSATGSLEKKIPTSYPISRKNKGLMHKKILLIDDAQVFLGSANFTPTSLCLHDNIVLGLYHKGLAHFLLHSPEQSFSSCFSEQTFEFWHLPDFHHRCLNHLLDLLNSATTSIRAALFTFTHPQLLEALLAAKRRGVRVEIAIDFYAMRGASCNIAKALLAEGVSPLMSAGGGKLLHHKWCLVDYQHLILGSANWTRSAFQKNEDFICILHDLTQEQNQCLEKIWKRIQSESNPVQSYDL